MKHVLTVIAFLALLSGCTAGPAATTPRATDAQKKQLFDRVATLAGTWEMKDDKGQTKTASVFAVTAGGSVVREIMFPGDHHEMTNAYHMDGSTLILTHYCAAGNQPRMRAACGPNPNIFNFQFDSVTDLHDTKDEYMGQMRLTIIDGDHIKQEWFSYVGGKLSEPTTFDLTRKH